LKCLASRRGHFAHFETNVMSRISGLDPKAATRVGVLAMAVGLVPSGSLFPQGPESDAVTAAAAAVIIAHEHLLQNTRGLAEGVARLDARELPRPTGAKESPPERHDASFLVSLEEVLGLDASERADVLRCPEGPGSCALDGASMLIAVGIPRIEGARAIVPVEITYRSELGRWPILRNGWEVILEREDDKWRFVRFGTRWAT